MQKIVEELEKFGFSKIEGMVYISLIKQPKQNGSQIAKQLNFPRTSIYAAIEKLYSIGAIMLIPETTNVYIAKDPVQFIKKLKEEYLFAADFLEKEIELIDNYQEQGDYVITKGEKNFINRIKEIINKSKEEVCLNTNIDLSYFEKEINEAANRGVRIIMFTFEKQEFSKYPIEVYHNPKLQKASKPIFYIKRVMIVGDCINGFIGNGVSGREFVGTYSTNELFVKVILEHIHHDIYILGLEKEYGDSWYEKFKLGTKHEKNFAKTINCKENM